MTDVRTFRAATIQEALDLVRDEMGREAVILHTRQISKRRLLPWRKPSESVEVTAGVGVNVRPPKGAQREGKPGFGRPRNSIGNASKRESQIQPNELAERMLDSGISLETAAGRRPAAPAKSKPPTPQAPSHDGRPSAGTEAGKGSADPAVSEKLDAIQTMIAELGRAGLRGRPEDVPSELFALYTELIDADVEDDVARDLVFRLKQTAAPEQIADSKAARALLTGVVESQLSCTRPIEPVSGKRRVVALVGATGVGKTTTIAKLAAGFRLRNGVKMGLVTVDTYRIAAVEQLRTYAQIIDLPMKVVTSPPEMRRALDELVGLDLVLIDTAGRSPRDDLQIQELKSLLAEAAVDDVHLVMSMTSSMRSLQATAEKFQAANPTSLILTKLDEAAGLGSVLTLTRKVSLPISYLTTGQDVPDDIEPANSTRLARLILGQETLLN